MEIECSEPRVVQRTQNANARENADWNRAIPPQETECSEPHVSEQQTKIETPPKEVV